MLMNRHASLDEQIASQVVEPIQVVNRGCTFHVMSCRYGTVNWTLVIERIHLGVHKIFRLLILFQTIQERRILMDSQLLLWLLTFIKDLVLVHYLYFITLSIKYSTFPAEVLEQASEDSLLQDPLFMLSRLIEGIFIERFCILIFLNKYIFCHHFLKLQAQKVHLFHRLKLKAVFFTVLGNE